MLTRQSHRSTLEKRLCLVSRTSHWYHALKPQGVPTTITLRIMDLPGTHEAEGVIENLTALLFPCHEISTVRKESLHAGSITLRPTLSPGPEPGPAWSLNTIPRNPSKRLFCPHRVHGIVGGALPFRHLFTTL